MKSFKSILEEGHSKKNTLDILAAIQKDNSKINELMKLFFSSDLRMCQRASWAVGMIGERNKTLLLPYFDKMLHVIKNPMHDAIVRNTLRTWREMDIPEAYEGEVFDICFNYLQDTKTPVAIRMFGMCILSNIAMKYPELKEEIIPVIEEHYEQASPGFKSGAKRELKRMKR